MRIAVIVVASVALLSAFLVGWSCCAVAKREDERMSEAWRRRW